MSKGTDRRTVRVAPELWGAARAVADQNGETVSDIIRQALERYTMSAAATITKGDILWQVVESIAGSPDSDTIDVAKVADEVVRVYGFVGIDSIDHDDYWAIVARFDSTQV